MAEGTADGRSSMTRSDEELLVRRVRRPREVVRIRRVVSTRQVTLTADVRYEELVVERLPVDDDPDTWSSLPPPPAGDGQYRYVLHEEVPEVSLATVPREQVTVSFPVASWSVTVTGALAREVISADVRPGDG